jgi:hypothetical protein
MLIVKGYEFYPQRTFENINPQNLPLWPLMFITIACGAVSGFHATQSPMMARCLPKREIRPQRVLRFDDRRRRHRVDLGHPGHVFFHTPEALNKVLAEGGPGSWSTRCPPRCWGNSGASWPFIGVVVLPITSGDTAFRSARLIIADIFKLSQKENLKRLVIALPLFAVGFSDLAFRFRPHLALFRLGQPDPGHGGALDGGHVSGAGQRKFHWVATIPAASS